MEKRSFISNNSKTKVQENCILHLQKSKIDECKKIYICPDSGYGIFICV